MLFCLWIVKYDSLCHSSWLYFCSLSRHSVAPVVCVNLCAQVENYETGRHMLATHNILDVACQFLRRWPPSLSLSFSPTNLSRHFTISKLKLIDFSTDDKIYNSHQKLIFFAYLKIKVWNWQKIIIIKLIKIIEKVIDYITELSSQ